MKTPRHLRLALVTAAFACAAEVPASVAPPVPAQDGVYSAVAQYAPPITSRRDTSGFLTIEEGQHRACDANASRSIWSSGPIEPGYLLGEPLPEESGTRYVAPQPDGLLAIARPLGGWVELWEPAPADQGCPAVEATVERNPPTRQCDDGEPLFPPGTVLESLGTGALDWRRIAIGETHLVECGPEWRAHAVPYRWLSCDGVPALEVRLPAVVVEDVDLRGPNRIRIGHPFYEFRMEVIGAPQACGGVP